MSAYTEFLASTASAQAQMAFQERMSNTAHVREVADLKAAGLNPVLSAGGSGASTPSGAEGDYSAVLPMLLSTVNNTAKALGKGVKNLTEAQLVNAITQSSEEDPDDLYSIIDSGVHSGLKGLLNFGLNKHRPGETLDEYIRRKDAEALEKYPMLKHFVDFSKGLASTTKVGRNYVKYVSDPLHMMLSRLLHKKNYEKKYGINQTGKSNSKKKYWKQKIISWWKSTPKTASRVYSSR